jgi:Tannase and feruloyl esterase
MKLQKNLAMRSALMLAFGVAVAPPVLAQQPHAVTPSDDPAACRALINVPNLTILSADITPAKGNTPEYCHVIGLIPPGNHWHMQLPLPSKWNGRLLNVGNGGKAGTLVYADHRLAEGYAIANSNMGHDNGAEPNSSFAFDNKQEAIDFGWRATHVTATASKTLVADYYGKAQKYAYWEGCSTGGRQGMMEVQRFPGDFDGIVVGSPVIDYEKLNAAHIWSLKALMKNHYEGNLAYDSNGNGHFDSVTKATILRDAVMAKCDAKDGVKDGVIDNPLACDFNPERDLADKMCPGDKNADACFTKAEMQTIKDLYSGPHDSKGKRILKGLQFGSEAQWPQNIIPYGGNNFAPSNLGYEIDHANFLFYGEAKGVPPADIKDLAYQENKTGAFPEYAWWDFNFDDFTAGKIDPMMKIFDATDPDLTRALIQKKVKLLMYQGWADGDAYPTMILDYYQEMVKATFKGNMDAAHEYARLFMAPGMGHCGGGPGPNEWDKLPPLVDWVENGKAPDYIVASHRSNRRDEQANSPVNNQRKLCPYPQHGVYVGPAGGQDDPKNWVEANFACKAN